MTKLCCVFNVPSLYREVIYKRIDSRYDCSWFFEDVTNDLNTFDISDLKEARVLKTIRVGSFYWVKGHMKLLFNQKYRTYLMIGPSRCLSIFLMLLFKCIFFPNKKTYLWTHGYYGKESYTERIWKKIMFKLATGIFVYGNYSRELMIKDGFNPQKLFTIHNSLAYDRQLEIRKSIIPSDIYKNYFENNYPVLIFIGRLMPVKKLNQLIEAVSILENKNDYYNVVFVGDGPERGILEQLVAEYKLKQRVWFYGACYDETKNAELVYNADLCVAPGNVGLTAIHSIMFGCPVLTHNDFKWQMPEFEAVTDGITGCFFERDNVLDLSNKISNWFVHNNKREIVRNACYNEIDTQWNPNYQMKVIKAVID